MNPFSGYAEAASEDHRQYHGQHAHDPAVICKAAEPALLRYTPEKAYRRDTGHHCDYHAYEICRDVRNINALLESVDQTYDVCAEHGGNGEQKREFHGKFPVKPGRYSGRDRGAGTRKAGYRCNALAKPDYKSVRYRHIRLRLCAALHFIGNIEHAAREHQRDADENIVIIQRLDHLMYRKDEHERQRRHDDHDEHARARIVPLSLPGERADVDKAQHLIEHLHDVLPVDDAYRRKRAEMQQYVKQHMSFIRRRKIKKIIKYREMP